MLKIYLQNGATAFDASKAKALWSKEFTNAKYSDQRSCATCHTTDLTKPGFHAVSRKEIDPLAVSAGKGRFQDAEKIETWFRRNCKWTWGRECTPQEKGDFLSFFNQL
ncbi:MAG: DUF1924 domain-containing protein [SAR324 cluster bacterium]|nr:DUF1924 domain-containing protein [SAR324 cluster bacterium]